MILSIMLNLLVFGTTNNAFGQCKCMMQYVMSVNSRPKVGFQDTSTTPSTWYLKSTEGIDKWDEYYYDSPYGFVTFHGYDNGKITTVDPKTLSNGSPDTYLTTSYSALNTTNYGSGYAYATTFLSCWTLWPQIFKNTTNGTWLFEGDTDCYSPVTNADFGDPFPWDLFASAGYTVSPNTYQLYVAYSTYSSPIEQDDAIWETIRTNVYTDANLRTNVINVLPPFSTNWISGNGGSAFYRVADADHSSISCAKMQYVVQVPHSIYRAFYLLGWQQNTYGPTTNLIASKNMTTTIYGTGNPTNPAVSQTYLVDVPTNLCTISVTLPKILASVVPRSSPPIPAGNGGPTGN